MTPMVFVLLALAGGAGAVCRFALDGVIRARLAGAAPWGTITINLSGSLALGILAGLAAARLLPGDWLLVIGSGFLGGYTTFSTASVETVRLLQERRFGAGAAVGLGTLVAAVALAGLGLWLGSRW